MLSSYSRCCDSCLERHVSVRKAGVKVEQVQYYHRAVACQIVSSPAKPFLAIEWFQPGEGEDTAALRLLGKLPDLYGSRFLDILLLDALYAQAPVLKLAERNGWDLVISLKQNQRELYQSAVRLFASRPPDCSGAEQHDGKDYQFQLWIRRDYRFPPIIPSPYGSYGPKRSSRRIITDGASFNPRPPTTNGSGLLPWTRRLFPPSWSVGSGMTAGNRKTTAGMI